MDFLKGGLMLWKKVAIFLTILLCFSLFSCDGSNKGTESIGDKARAAVRADIIAQLIVKYDISNVPDITYYIDECGENEY